MGSLPHLVEDCLGLVQLFSDGSVFRSNDINLPMKVHDDGSTVWKDILFDKTHNLHLRLYKPQAKYSPSDGKHKLPILYFFHGGGFCLGSRTWANFHTYCLHLASFLQAIVVAPDYRLAPEHRLPAALEDAISSVKWLQNEAKCGSEEWLGSEVVDFEKVFVVGDSSGGNLAHQLAVRLGGSSRELEPVRVRGYVLMGPFFGGTKRTISEAEGPPEKYLNVEMLDRFWRMSLPIGSTADHPLANPFGPLSPNLESTILDPILVIVGGSELMKDRILDYAKKLKHMRKDIEYIIFEGAQHGDFINEPFSQVANAVLQQMKEFISEKAV